MRQLGVSLGVATGLATTAAYVAAVPGVSALAWASVVVAIALGLVTVTTTIALSTSPARALLTTVVAVAPAALATSLFLALPLDPFVLASFVAGATLGAAARQRRRWVLVPAGALVTAFAVSPVAGAGAWSVNEPPAGDPRVVAGNGIVVSMDTHAFLIQQGVAILRGDGRTATADFLLSPDPTAPLVRDAAGRVTKRHESFLWRLQRGARDADWTLKKSQMPDHFFNWWTHSGKGLVAGPSAATYAEQQFALAVKAWESGARAVATYHLGAATHLVDDACAPPHEFFLVPNHRSYENRMLAVQGTLAVDHGGIYREDFRVTTGHGGDEWSSSHTRGWVDECAHRAAELVLSTAQPPPSDPTSLGNLGGTFTHFRDTQRLTAGYLSFFFDSVGGP